MTIIRNARAVLRTRKALFLLSLTFVWIVWAIVLSTPEKEPTYKGKSLSEWLKVVALSDVRSPNLDPETIEAKSAIVCIATNMLPRLVRQIANKDEGMPSKIGLLVYYVPFVGDKLYESSIAPLRLADDATGIFYIIAEHGGPAAPDINRLLTTTSNAGVRARAAYCLMSIGEPAFPYIIAALTNTQPEVQLAITELLGAPRSWSLGTNVQTLTPILAGNAKTNSPLSRNSIRALGQLKQQPELAIPALNEALSSTNRVLRFEAVRALAAFGQRTSYRFAYGETNEPVHSATTNAVGFRKAIILL